MKNLINYYYNLVINQFKKNNEIFSFVIDKKEYEFLPFAGDINEFYKIYLTVKKSNKYCHEVIMNKDNRILTLYNNIPYILIRKNFNLEKLVDLNEILDYSIRIDKNRKLNWKKLWEDKIDYYEYQMSQISYKYPILKKSFNYYIGLTETSISLLNFVINNEIGSFICHRRIEPGETLDNFFNPVNFIIDNRIRDISEYIKVAYMCEYIPTNQIIDIINNLNLNGVESILLLARIMYPSYFFDAYDKIIQGKISEEKINYYIKKNTDYEVFLKKVYKVLKTKYGIPEIEWLNV